MTVFVPILVGCLITCFVNVSMNKILMGSKTAILPDTVEKLKNQSIPGKDVKPIDLKQVIIWAILPTILTAAVWGIIFNVLPSMMKQKSEIES